MNYHVARNGQQLGSLSVSDIQDKLAAGELSGGDLAWAEGMAQWQPISSIAELSGGRAPGSSSAPVNPYAAPQAEIMPVRSAQAGELASLGQRLGASLLDSVVALPGILAFVFAYVVIVKTQDSQSGVDSVSVSRALQWVGGIYLLGDAIYNLIRLSTHGQTVGKMWMGIRIAKFEDNSNPGFVKAVLLRIFLIYLIGAMPLFGLGAFFSLVDICFIFRADRRCIHDLIAGTHVLKA